MNAPELRAMLEALQALDWGRRQVLEVVEHIGHRCGTDDPEHCRLQQAQQRLAAAYAQLAGIYSGMPEEVPPEAKSRPRCNPELQQLAAELRAEGLQWEEVAVRIDQQTGVEISANTARRWAQVAGEQRESPMEGSDSAS